MAHLPPHRPPGASDAVTLPLRILVLADLLQGPDPRPLAERRPVVLDKAGFASVLAALAPRLELSVPHPRDPEAGASTRVSLAFKQLKDFTPEGIARQIPEARSLLEVRQSLNALKGPLGPVPSFKRRLNTVREDEASRAQIQHELTFSRAWPEGATTDDTLLGELLAEAKVGPTMDGYDTARRGLVALLEALLSPRYTGHPLDKTLVDAEIALFDAEISAWVRAVLHHPDFVRLEATWRTLHMLVHRVDGRENIVLEVLHCPKGTLQQDFEDAAELRQSGLFQQLSGAVSADAEGVPYGLVVADFAFGASRDDLWLLGRCGAVAEAMHCPFLADAAHDLLADDASAARWEHFWSSGAAQHVALCLPRVLLRLPYGACTVPVKRFNFEEVDEGAEGPLLWGSAAVVTAALVSESVARGGGASREGQPVAHLDGLPRFQFAREDAVIARGPTAQPLSAEEAPRLAGRGLVALACTDDPTGEGWTASLRAYLPLALAHAH